MKRLSLTVLLLLLATSCFAGFGMQIIEGPVPVSGGGCSGACNTETAYEEQTAGTTDMALGNAAGYYYIGMFWTPSESKCVCRFTLNMTMSTGDISGKTFVAEIWSVDGTTLNTKLGTSSGVTGSNSWAATDVDFDFSSHVSATASTVYAITITMNETDGSNYTKTYLNGSGAWSNASAARWNSDGTISSNLTTYDARAKIYVE